MIYSPDILLGFILGSGSVFMVVFFITAISVYRKDKLEIEQTQFKVETIREFLEMINNKETEDNVLPLKK